MNYMLDSISEMQRILFNFNQIMIVGAGWIGKVLYYWLMYSDVERERVKVVQSENDVDISWNGLQLYKMDNISDVGENCIIVSQKELYGNRYALELRQKGYKNVFFLSEKLKNELDKQLMQVDSELYEREIFVARKEELDKGMDESTKNTIKSIVSQKEFPVFQTIEIETINRCNGTCKFCPINSADDTRIYKKMDNQLFEKIIEELAEINYSGRLNLFSNNEPLIDNRIENFTEYVATKLPQAKKILFTNGTLLNMERFETLLKNLDLMCIDIYYDNDVLAELNKDLIGILKKGLANSDIQNKVMVQFICRSAVRNNRGGQSRNRHISYFVQAGCLLPYIQMVIRPDGKVSLCCNDPLGKNTLGDVSKNTLMEIWNSFKYNEIRKKIGDTRQKFNFCTKCDNYASLNTQGKNVFSAKQHMDAWEQVKKYISQGE